MNCNLSGSLPENIGDLEYLEALWLNSNQLFGEVPVSIGNLTNLELLYLSDNQLSGSIPENLCNLSLDWGGVNNWGVEYFNINGNAFCPPYPTCMDVEIIGDQYCIELIGDLNVDGVLNILDVVFLVDIILESVDYIFTADLNQDNTVNILDIISLVTLTFEELER